MLIEKVEIAEEKLPFKLMPNIVQQPCGTIHLTRGLEVVQTPQRGDYPLAAG